MSRYDGKRVVIIGGTSGIRLATANLLGGEGGRVMVTGHGEAALEAARADLGAGAVVRSDVASIAEMDALADRVKAKFGGLDALLVCAGMNLFVPFDQMTEEQYDDVFAVNAKGAYFTIQKLSPLIAEGGAVVVVTSVANVIGQPMISAYAASKAALRSMVRSLANCCRVAFGSTPAAPAPSTAESWRRRCRKRPRTRPSDR